MNFKDLQYSIGKFKADVHSQIAKNNPLQKQDTRALSLWISQERYDLASMRTVAYERSETVKALKNWIKEEMAEEKPENARDLEDIVGDKLCRLLDKQIEVEQEFAGKYQQYRHAIKSIREREEKLSNQRERKRSLQTRIANLVKTSPKSPRIAEFEKELNVLQRDTQGSEMDLADFKRFALKEAFYLRFNAMHEYGHKLALVAGFGKYLTDLIDAEPTTTETRKRYEKGPEAQEIIDDAVEALREWKPMAGDERPTLADGKGKSPSLMSSSSELTTPTSKIPPKLPPRRPSQRPSIMSGASSSSSLSPPPPNATGDLKTEPDVQIDLYDPPPPAYDNPASPTFSYQGSSAASSRISPATITDSPVPMHRPLPPPQPQDPYSPIYNPINYEQLYHQQQQQQQSNHHRPYADFLLHQQQQQYGARVDAGGFRIPVNEGQYYDNADDEKARLAQHYRQQEQQQHSLPQNSHNNLHEYSSSPSQAHLSNNYEEKIQDEEQ